MLVRYIRSVFKETYKYGTMIMMIMMMMIIIIIIYNNRREI
jgi:hypothetical protein